MEMEIRIGRSVEWTNAQSLEHGRNVPREIKVRVNIAKLSVEARKILQIVRNWDGTRSFPSVWDGDVDTGFEWATGHTGHGRLPPVVDADNPTIEQIDEAIIAADAALRAKKQAVDEEKARKLAERKARAEEWAAIPLELRTADDYPGYCCPMGEAPNGYRGPLFGTGLAIFDVQDLQRFVPQAWEEADRACAQRRERQEHQQAIADRALLANFLASFPPDALRGALKAYAGKNLRAVREQIEDASPVVIFDDDDDDDNDDNDD